MSGEMAGEVGQPTTGGGGMTLGMIGLGAMGAPMARRLLDNGFGLVVHDLDADAVSGLVAAGAVAAASPADVASRAELVLVCLPSIAASEAVALGPNGVIHGTRVRYHVEMSTIGAACLQALAEGLARRGIVTIDAPVSGGQAAVKAGRLTCMVAAAPDDFLAVAPALRGFCHRLFHVGEHPGQAQVLKLANNMLNAGNFSLAVEMVLMARRAGIHEALAVEVINASTGRSRATEETFQTQILTGLFQTGGKLSIAHKDVQLAVAQAEALGVEHSVAKAVSALWQAAEREGHGSQDLSRLYPIVDAMATAPHNEFNQETP